LPKIPPELLASIDAVEALLREPGPGPWPARDADLASLRAARERLERRFTLAVVGEFSSGKSYLLNALLRKTRYDASGRIVGLLATDINPSTATITELEYGKPEAAVARYPSGRTERIALDHLSRFVAVGKNDAPGALHDATADEDAAPSFVNVSVDSAFLASGFTVADTPGLASLNPSHRRATLAYLPRADAVLYLIDTQQPFTEGDATFLGTIGEHVRTIFIVQTKIDLWRAREGEATAWEAARERIVQRAARFAPEAEVYAVSARDYAAGTLDGDAAAIASSGFPALLAGLERSLEERAQAARNARTLALLRDLTAKAATRIRRATALAAESQPALETERERTLAAVTERERALGRERDDVTKAGVTARAWIVAQGEALSDRATRALGSAIDVADIERVRDRGRFHSLVDATTAPIWTAFANDVGGHVARALERIERAGHDVRVADVAARRLGGEPGVGSWSRDLARGIASTIVLRAIGGPGASFANAVAGGFAGAPPGTYMKRELGSDLYGSHFPQLQADIAELVRTVASDLGSIYDDVAASIERERGDARDEALGPIERALAAVRNDATHANSIAAFSAATLRLEQTEALVASTAAALRGRETESGTRLASATENEGLPPEASPFDAEAYDRGLRPERYRVVILGALRRGKSSLINAVAGTRLLSDDSATEARYPVHVRYGERDRAYALEESGNWAEIDSGDAMARAAHAPVLIETPWDLPRQLVLVHAPAFDSGNPQAEEIALVAAQAASETVGLFSRQLSDRELGLFARVAAFERPMLLAHTIADNESSSERRTVVELAGRYLAERGIIVNRIFTISALDYLEAIRSERRPAPWNELLALRETLAAHAEEHMRKLEEKSHRSQAPEVPAKPATERKSLRRSLSRLFGRDSSLLEP
jgi:predicted GTPase